MVNTCTLVTGKGETPGAAGKLAGNCLPSLLATLVCLKGTWCRHCYASLLVLECEQVCHLLSQVSDQRAGGDTPGGVNQVELLL